jgi:hypothetical protein
MDSGPVWKAQSFSRIGLPVSWGHMPVIESYYAIVSAEFGKVESIGCSTIGPEKLAATALNLNGNLDQFGAQSGDCCNNQARRPARSILLLLHVAAGCRSGGLWLPLHDRQEPAPSSTAATVSALCSCGCVHRVADFLHLANGIGQNAERPRASTDRVVRDCHGQRDGGVGRFHRDHHDTVRLDSVAPKPSRIRSDDSAV